MSAGMEIQLIAVFVAVACALPGTFLVLRKMSMMSDAITHTILLGIVIAFFITHDLNSPYLMLGATLIGLVTVWLTEMLSKTQLVAEDSAIGVVFPLLFSVAIILISKYAGQVHLDTDSVLLGELAFAPFDRMKVFGVDIGAKALYTSGALLVINLSFITIFFKELKVSTFDPLLSAVMGFSPVFFHYMLMTLVSLTTVGSFDAVGSILVIAFMIAPPITAYLLTDNLKLMLVLSALIGAISGVLGYQTAHALDVSIAGTMAVYTGILFLIVFIVAPKRGMISVYLRRQNQKSIFAQTTLLLHLHNHKDKLEANVENGVATICNHLHWTTHKFQVVSSALCKAGKIKVENGVYKLTDLGETTLHQAVDHLLAIE